MKPKLLLRLLVLLVIPALACTLSGGPDTLPPTETPAPVSQPNATPTPANNNNGLFILNLSQSDEAGLNKRADEIYQSIINSGGEVSRTVLLDAYAKLATLKHVGGQWNSAGPAPISGVYVPGSRLPGSGRVNGFVVDPRDSNTVYAAISIGGIWKTTDGGQTWASLTDQQVPLIYGGIVMDPKNPDTLYAPLNEFDANLSQIYGYLANGIMRTRDAGKTWQLIGQDAFLGAAVSSLVFDAKGKMYASSGERNTYYGPDNMPDFGIFSSDDGGDTWQRLAACQDFGSCVPKSGGQHRSLLGGFFDVKVASNGVLYATSCIFNCHSAGMIRSKDGGKTWDKLDVSSAMKKWEQANQQTVDFADDAKTEPTLTSFKIAVAPDDPNLVIAGGGIDYVNKPLDGHSSWVLRSTDGGDTWEWLQNAGDYCTNEGSSPQCDYDNVIKFDPTNSKIIYVGGSFSTDPETKYWISVLRRSTDGGDTWTDLTPAVDGSFMHPDLHALTFDPNDPNVLWIGNDGGVYRTPDINADPPKWETHSDGLSTLLMIDVALHPTDPNYLLAGMQDNARATTDDRQTWNGTAQGDGAFVAVDPFQPNIVYGSIYHPFIFERNSKGGVGSPASWSPPRSYGYVKGLDGKNDNWPFYPPFALDPNTEGVLYIGSNRIYRTDNRGDQWKPVSDYINKTNYGEVQSIVVAPSDSNTIYSGTTDGTAWASTDGSKTWTEISGSNFPPRNLNRLAVDPNDPKIIYAVFNGFNVQTPDTPGHVFISHDGGGSWADISYDLPDAPLSSVVVDTRDKYAGIYVGGALGVWVLQNGTKNWLPYGTGMPLALVTSLKLNPTTGVMAAATYGRSAWVLDMP